MKKGFRFFIFLIIAVISIFMIYLPYVEIKEKTVSKLNEKQLLIAKQAAYSIENFFTEQIKLLNHFASSSNFIHLTEKAKEAMGKEYQYNSAYVKAVTRYDSKGNIIYSYPNPENVIGMNISSQTHVKKILKEHKTNISDVFTSVQGFQSVAISEPIFDKGEFIGVIAFLIDFRYLAKNFIENIMIGDDGYAWMISRDGTELYCPVPDHVGQSIEETSSVFPTVIAMADKMRQGLSGNTTYEYNMVKGAKTETIVKHASYYPVRLQGNFLSIVVATPEKEIYVELSSFYKKMIAAIVILLIAFAFLAYLVINDYNLSKINKELEARVDREMEKRKSNEKLMLQQAKFYSMGETMSAIAHQWRQPLNTVGLCIQDMDDAYKLNQIDEKYISDIVSVSMKNLKQLSDTIDDFSKFFAPTEEIQNLNICKVIFSIHNIIRVQFDNLCIGLQFHVDGRIASSYEDCDPKVYTAETYPDVLKQVVMNCLQNSKDAVVSRLEAGEIEKGEILLSLSHDDGCFRIEILDNGGGIPDEHIDKVFDPYFSTKGVAVGMGLGLYVSQNILKDYLNGTMSIENIPSGAKAVIKFKTS
ncbi:MAG: hypothetical protein C0603_10765 [Denitrovibrio sp.]|nr:MAG: hypothetical protein C0603_10765 [Denitrovibrio sp.]